MFYLFHGYFTDILVLYHSSQHKVLIDSRNANLVHHLDLFECGPEDTFNDTQLPDGICDDILTKMRMCSSKLATAWAIGGDLVREKQL